MNLVLDKTSSRSYGSQISKALNYLKYVTQPYVVALIFLAIYGIFGFVQYSQVQEQKRAAEELAQAQRILDRPTLDRAVLEDRMVEAQEAMILQRGEFPAQQTADVLLAAIRRMATDSGLLVNKTTISIVREETIAQIKYLVSPFDVQATGSLEQISAFLELLEDGALSTILISNINVTRADDAYALTARFSVYGRAPIVDSLRPTSKVRELPSFRAEGGMVSVEVPYAAWDETNPNEKEYSGLDYVELYYRISSTGDYTMYTTTFNPQGRWTQSPISLSIAAGNVLELYTIAVDKAGNREAAPLTADVTSITRSR